MTTLQQMGEQPLIPDSEVSIMLKSADRWEQLAAFVALTMHRKMEIVREQQRRPIVIATQHLMPDLIFSPSVFAISNTATEEEEDDPGWSHLEISTSCQDTS